MAFTHFIHFFPYLPIIETCLLLKKFGSVQAVLAASEQELQHMAGIGASTARKIRWAVEEPKGGYGRTDLT